MNIQVTLAFISGLVFITVLLVLAMFFPEPTPFQYTVFRIVLAIAAAGFAAVIPGLLHLQIRPGLGAVVRASGAIAVFAIIFFFNPAKLATSTPTQPLQLGDIGEPSVVSFGLSKESVGYEDIQSKIFAASLETMRTFAPAYPPADEPHLVLSVSVKNPLNQDLVITHITYDIEQVGGVKGAPAGPLNTVATYEHRIHHVTGSQRKRLPTPFNVPAESTAVFDLEIKSASPGTGLGWILKILIETDKGKYETEQFQLYLPKISEALGLIPAQQEITPNLPSHRSSFPPLRLKLSDFDAKYRECLFSRAGILRDLNGLDEYERDLIFLWAARSTPKDFSEKSTKTDPVRKYKELLSTRKIEILLLLTKTQPSCNAS